MLTGVPQFNEFLVTHKKRTHRSELCIDRYGIPGCRVFKRGVQNWKDFCLKINIPKGNYWNLKIGVNGKVSKSAEIQLSKSSESFSIFIFIEEYQFRSTFLLLTFLIASIFKSLYFPKWWPIFNTSLLHQFSFSIISFGYVDF